MSLPQILSQLSGGMVRTVGIFFLTLIFSLPLGLVISFGRMAKNPVLKNLFKIYISVMRGTPLMLQLMVFYFGPYYLFKMNIGGNWRFTAIILSFSLNYAAYFAEIFRGGIESIPKGQYEAAAALGFTKSQTFFRIILPQVIKRIVPASSNEIITLVKDTSIANVVAYAEITLKARQQMQLYSSLIPLIIAGVFYFAMAMILTFVFSLIEKKLSYYK